MQHEVSRSACGLSVTLAYRQNFMPWPQVNHAMFDGQEQLLRTAL